MYTKKSHLQINFIQTSCKLETILGKNLVNDNTHANVKLGGDLILTCWWTWLLWLTQINFLWSLLLSLRLSWSFLPIQIDQPSKADWKPLFQSNLYLYLVNSYFHYLCCSIWLWAFTCISKPKQEPGIIWKWKREVNIYWAPTVC